MRRLLLVAVLSVVTTAVAVVTSVGLDGCSTDCKNVTVTWADGLPTWYVWKYADEESSCWSCG